MCLSIPFRIYFRDISDIIKDCFGLKDDKSFKKNSEQPEINMDIIEAQPISDDEGTVFLPNSSDELDKSYDFMDSE